MPREAILLLGDVLECGDGLFSCDFDIERLPGVIVLHIAGKAEERGQVYGCRK
jgi:hypothetical protein